jgi:sortase A
MKKFTDFDNISEKQIRRLIIKKRIDARRRRIKRFNKTNLLQANFHATEKNTSRDRIEDVLTSNTLSRQPLRKRITEKFLLGIELSVIISFIVVIFLGINAFKALNQEFAASYLQPTLIATPLIRSVVIPGGHKPPTDPGGARFNEDEIPEHLRAEVSSYYNNLQIPTPMPETAVRVQIPAIDIDAPIVQGDGWEQLKLGVGQHIGSGLPGQPGNVVLSAHNDIYGELFRHLDKLAPGDSIIVYSTTSAYTYEIQETIIVEPTDVWVMDPTANATTTLISCYPYLVNTKRIIVKAELVS